MIPSRLGRRARHRGLHGHELIDRERRAALWMIYTALARVLVWALITVAFIIGIGVVVGWFGSVKFVSLLSILALLLTDWGQYAASRAQLAAVDAHQDAEHNRRALSVDTAAIESDIARLARLQPCPEADALAESIARKLNPPPEEPA